MDDELQPSPDWNPDPERRSSTGTLAAAVAAVVLAAAGIAYFAFRRTPPPPPAPAPAAEAPAAAATAQTAPAAAVNLPALDESDAFVRGQLLPLSASGIWSSWLGHDSLVRRFVAAVLSIAERKNPRPVLAEVASVRGPFAVRREAGRLVIDPATHARYDGIVDTLQSIDVGAARPAWKILRPLVESAWNEVASPEQSLDATLREVFDHLLAAPVPPESIEVEAHEGVYVYRDRELEALSPAQKLIVRTGAANGARLHALLLEWRGLF
ncbi:MAG: DUF3014 domain-containing protein [Thermoanaerobaculia bacterium]